MSEDFKGKHIVLGICGGIAAYKAAFLARQLSQLGAVVRVVMTLSAQTFITPLTLQALTNQSVSVDLLDTEAERAMGHIELARWADMMVIAPASANTLAKMAHGLADDLLSTLYLVTRAPVLVCPAMNQAMWHHEATIENILQLQARGVIVVGPDAGEQACGDVGMGRLCDISLIIEAMRLVTVSGRLKGQHVLITAGPTEEALDPVRYLTNHSSGKMGYALANAALMSGAEVTLVSGPCTEVCLPGIRLKRVSSAKEMLEAVNNYLPEITIFIGAAAVCDYRAEQIHPSKIKKHNQDTLTLSLVKNPDILATMVNQKQRLLVVGFAAETENVLAYAKQKMLAKGVDVMIANQVGAGLGFHELNHEVTLLFKDGSAPIALTKQHKTRLAGEIIAIIASKLHNDATLKAGERRE